MHVHTWPAPSPPQAATVELTAKFLRLMAAFTSRSWLTLHRGHTHCRVPKPSNRCMYPQDEHSLLLGYHRSANTIPPSASLRFISKLASHFIKAHVGDGTSQIAVFQHPLHMQVFDNDRVKAACNASGKLMQAVTSQVGDPAVGRATFSFASTQFREPFIFLERLRPRRRNFCRSALSALGPATFSPFESVAKAVTPKSIPTTP